MVETMIWKIIAWSSLQRHHRPTKFYENPPIGSIVIKGNTDRQTGDIISLLFLLESRLKYI
jgi:hypothetical protein